MQIMKTVKKYGNSGGIYVPASWIGGKVKVELMEEPLNPIKDILSKMPLEHLVSAAVYGSCARKEASHDSDIDVLLITDDDAKIDIPSELKQRYDIQVKSASAVRNALAHDPVFYKIINDEAVAIINHNFLDSLKKTTPKPGSIKARIALAESSLNIIKEIADAGYTDMAYPLVMRFKEALLMDCFLSGKKYSTKAMKRELQKDIGMKETSAIINAYREARDNKVSVPVSKDTIIRMISILEKRIQNARQKAREKRH